MESPVAESVLYPITQYGMPIRTTLISGSVAGFFAIILSMPFDWQAIIPFFGDLVFLVPWGVLLVWLSFVRGLIYRNPFLENCWGVRFLPPSTHYKRADNMVAGHRLRFGARRWRLEV